VLLLGESTQCSKKFDDEPINTAPSKNKIKCECTQELIININHTRYVPQFNFYYGIVP